MEIIHLRNDGGIDKQWDISCYDGDLVPYCAATKGPFLQVVIDATLAGVVCAGCNHGAKQAQAAGVISVLRSTTPGVACA